MLAAMKLPLIAKIPKFMPSSNNAKGHFNFYVMQNFLKKNLYCKFDQYSLCN